MLFRGGVDDECLAAIGTGVADSVFLHSIRMALGIARLKLGLLDRFFDFLSEVFSGRGVGPLPNYGSQFLVVLLPSLLTETFQDVGSDLVPSLLCGFLFRYGLNLVSSSVFDCLHQSNGMTHQIFDRPVALGAKILYRLGFVDC